MPPPGQSVSRLLFGLAAATGTFSIVGFLYLYWKKKKRQKSIENEIKGSNRKKPKNLAPSLPPPTGKTGVVGSDISDSVEKEISSKELLETNSKVDIDVANPPNLPLGMQEKSINFEIRISQQNISSLIGKGGSNIRKLQKDTNTRIVPRGERLENGDKIFIIVGLPDAVALAENKISKLIMSQPVLNTSQMIVPEHSLGRIIGRQGENIRMIQDVSSTRIDIPPLNNEKGKYFTDEDYDAPVVGDKRVINIRGTDEQIDHARKLITVSIEEDATLRDRIRATTARRTPRTNPTKSIPSKDQQNVDLVPLDNSSFPLRQDKPMDMFVSCIYHPNKFFVQLMGDAIKLDKLCEDMTSYYYQNSKDEEIVTDFAVGDLVVLNFDHDCKMYRAKIQSINEDIAEIVYIDYGDTRQRKITELRKMRPEFLKLRFQAISATLNLECLDENGRWSDEVINELYEQTKCATWVRIKAKVLGYLRDPTEGNHDTIWVELYNIQDRSIANILIAKGFASATKENKPNPIAKPTVKPNPTIGSLASTNQGVSFGSNKQQNTTENGN